MRPLASSLSRFRARQPLPQPALPRRPVIPLVKSTGHGCSVQAYIIHLRSHWNAFCSYFNTQATAVPDAPPMPTVIATTEDTISLQWARGPPAAPAQSVFSEARSRTHL